MTEVESLRNILNHFKIKEAFLAAIADQNKTCEIRLSPKQVFELCSILYCDENMTVSHEWFIRTFIRQSEIVDSNTFEKLVLETEEQEIIEPAPYGRKNLLQEAVEAANWWAKALQDKLSGGDGILPGDDSFIMSALSKAYQRNDAASLSNEQIESFRKALAFIVQELILNSNRWNSWEKAKENPAIGRSLRILEVDYEPCPELRAAWQSAGGDINAQPFPIKTMMWVSPGVIEVRLGYGGKTEVVWSAYKLLDSVRLLEYLPNCDLKVGDIGTIVEILRDGAAFEVEFSDEDGRTRESIGLTPKQVTKVNAL